MVKGPRPLIWPTVKEENFDNTLARLFNLSHLRYRRHLKTESERTDVEGGG